MIKILFFSSVADVKLFNLTGFYVEDIKALKNAGFKVEITNKYLSFFKFWKYDVAFLYFYKKAIIPALIARCFFKKIIYTGGVDEISSEIFLSKKKKFIFKLFFILNCFLSNRCNIVSNSDMKNAIQIFSKKLRWLENKLSYYPHSIDTIKYITPDISIKEDICVTICWMSSIENVKRKGVDKAIFFFKSIKNTHPNFKLYIVGSLGEGSDFLKAIILKEGLTDSIIFTGEISEVKKIDLLKRSKFYLQFSSYEGFGLAVIEAMALKNLILHSGNGGLKDTIADKGFIVKDFVYFQDAIRIFNDLNLNFNNNNKLLEANWKVVINQFSSQSRSKYFKELIKNIC